MRIVQTSIALLFCVLLAGCSPLAPLLVPMSEGLVGEPFSGFAATEPFTETDVNSAPEDGLCAPEDIECTLQSGTIIQLTAMCEPPHSVPESISGDGDNCIGTYAYKDWILEPESRVTAYHNGDGLFEVTLFRDDGSSDVLFSATGVYTSEPITLASTGIVSMTVQSTGPWRVEVNLVDE